MIFVYGWWFATSYPGFLLWWFVVVNSQLMYIKFLFFVDLSDSGSISVSEDDFSEDVLNVLDGAKKLFQYDASRRQATSIIMLAVIGSEFQKDVGSLTGTKTEHVSSDGKKNVASQGNSFLELVGLNSFTGFLATILTNEHSIANKIYLRFFFVFLQVNFCFHHV